MSYVLQSQVKKLKTTLRLKNGESCYKMKTLNWRRKGWFAKKFIFFVEQQIIGQLNFNSSWNFNALYSDKESELKFAQKSFWERDVIITIDEKKVGKIHVGIFGEQTLKLETGERFILSTNLWEQEVFWKDEKGETIIKYKQAKMSSMGKGLISSKESLTIEMEKLLISSGVFIRQLTRKRRTIIVAIMIPIIAAANRH